MSSSTADIIARLRKQLDPLQGLRPALNGIAVENGTGRKKLPFPMTSYLLEPPMNLFMMILKQLRPPVVLCLVCSLH
jgi:hypothetical protein